MNCKPGDVAVILSGHNRYELVGEFVLVLKASPHGPGHWLVQNTAVEETARREGISPSIKDCFLRPIRGVGGTDEILRIAGKPRKETVK